MDADLYDHLSTTITTDTHQQDDTDAKEDIRVSVDRHSQGQVPRESTEGAARSDVPRPRKRTMSSSLPEEIDQVVQAISSSHWASKLGTLMGSVKKQGETVFETTKERATKEFEHVRSGFASFTSPPESPTEETNDRLEEQDRSISDSSKQREHETSPRLTPGFMFQYLRSTADAAQKKLTPTLKELSKAEDAADAYLNKLGASFGQLLKDVVTIAPPEESSSHSKPDDDVLFNAAAEKKRKIGVSRVDALLGELHSNPEVFLSDPNSSQEPSFAIWKGDFSAEKSTDDIAALLERYPDLRDQMDHLVPEKVSYKDFWMRYMFQKSKIDADETKRKQLFQSGADESDFDWGEDDEAEYEADKNENIKSHQGKISIETVKPNSSSTNQPSESAPRNSRSSESSTSFDIVSQSSAVPPPGKEKQTTEESDDDWE